MGTLGATTVLLVTAIGVTQGQVEDVNVRLFGGNKFVEAGLVEIWRDGAWGLLCDGNRGWNLEAGNLVCQSLGFARARRVDHGSTGYAQVGCSWLIIQSYKIPSKVPPEARLAASGLTCNQVPNLGRCQFNWGSQQVRIEL